MALFDIQILLNSISPPPPRTPLAELTTISQGPCRLPRRIPTPHSSPHRRRGRRGLVFSAPTNSHWRWPLNPTSGSAPETEPVKAGSRDRQALLQLVGRNVLSR